MKKEDISQNKKQELGAKIFLASTAVVTFICAIFMIIVSAQYPNWVEEHNKIIKVSTMFIFALCSTTLAHYFYLQPEEKTKKLSKIILKILIIVWFTIVIVSIYIFIHQ